MTTPSIPTPPDAAQIAAASIAATAPSASAGAVRTPWREFWRKFKKQHVAVAALAFVLLLVAVAGARWPGGGPGRRLPRAVAASAGLVLLALAAVDADGLVASTSLKAPSLSPKKTAPKKKRAKSIGPGGLVQGDPAGEVERVGQLEVRRLRHRLLQLEGGEPGVQDGYGASRRGVHLHAQGQARLLVGPHVDPRDSGAVVGRHETQPGGGASGDPS